MKKREEKKKESFQFLKKNTKKKPLSPPSLIHNSFKNKKNKKDRYFLYAKFTKERQSHYSTQLASIFIYFLNYFF